MKSSGPKDSELKKLNLVVVAHLAKRHTFKENKWKAVSHSGIASPWLENIKEVCLSENGKLSEKIPVKVEVPLSHSAEFFVSLPENFETGTCEVLVDRNLFPPVTEKEFYICDVLGSEIETDLGTFKLLAFFENADPRGTISSISLLLESLNPIKGQTVKVEVPIGILSRSQDKWHISDIEMWINLSNTKDE